MDNDDIVGALWALFALNVAYFMFLLGRRKSKKPVSATAPAGVRLENRQEMETKVAAPEVVVPEVGGKNWWNSKISTRNLPPKKPIDEPTLSFMDPQTFGLPQVSGAAEHGPGSVGKKRKKREPRVPDPSITPLDPELFPMPEQKPPESP